MSVGPFLSGVNRRTLLSVAGAGLSASLAGCAGTGTDTAGEFDVGMTARRFEPARIDVAPGTTVVWRNTSAVAHTVTAREEQIPDGAAFFASGGYETQSDAEQAWGERGGAMDESESFAHEFTVPGEYTYYCVPHEAAGMAGVVTVSESAGDA
jgi:Plastocyanin